MVGPLITALVLLTSDDVADDEGKEELVGVVCEG